LLSAACCWLSLGSFREVVWLEDDFSEVSCSWADPGFEAEVWLLLVVWLDFSSGGLVALGVPVVRQATNNKHARITDSRLRVFITVCKIRFCYLGVKQ
jgi:hypothetical protein